MKIAKPMKRRTLLRGAGTVAIGLPMLDAMHTRSGFAQPGEGAARAFNVSFGLGLEVDMQGSEALGDDYAGPAAGGDGVPDMDVRPLEVLRPLRDKLLILRGINYRKGDHGGNSHLESTSFTGTSGGERIAGGPSLDQVLRVHDNPMGMPRGMLSAVHGGLAYEWEQAARFNRCWNVDGSVAGEFDHRADRFFERIFGDAMAGMPPATDASERAAREACRRRRSILDAVVSQYRHYMSDGSNLGTASRTKIALHLERIREVEQRIYNCDAEDLNAQMPNGMMCEGPGAPSDFLTNGHGDYKDVTVAQLDRSWRMMVDAFVLGAQCDLVRFGAMVYMAQGARIHLTGEYDHEGRRIADFDDRRHGFSNRASHEFWHSYPGNDRAKRWARAHAHYMLRQCAYFLERLDDPDHLDEAGRTLLESSMVTLATEGGRGAHGSAELENVFHAISPAGGRFRTGYIDLGDAHAQDLYNTMLKAHGVPDELLLGDGNAGIGDILACSRDVAAVCEGSS